MASILGVRSGQLGHSSSARTKRKISLRSYPVTNEEVSRHIKDIEKDNQTLKEKVQSLETTRTIALVLAVFFGLGEGVGYFLLRQLSNLDYQKQEINNAKNQAIRDAKDEIERYASSELLSYVDAPNETDGCAQIKDFQICWGTKLSSTNEDPRYRTARKADFDFKHPFMGTPIVSEAIHGDNPPNPGFTYAAYGHNTDSRRYHVDLSPTRDPGTPDTAQAWVSYIAVGKWR